MSNPLAFNELFKLLLTHCTKPDGSHHKASDVARATGISPSNLSLMINGQRSNTTIETVRSILRYFQVSFEVLNASTEAEVIALVTPDQPKPEPILHLRGKFSRDLSPQALHQIEQLIEYVLLKEYAEQIGLPAPPIPGLDAPDTNGSH